MLRVQDERSIGGVVCQYNLHATEFQLEKVTAEEDFINVAAVGHAEMADSGSASHFSQPGSSQEVPSSSLSSSSSPPSPLQKIVQIIDSCPSFDQSTATEVATILFERKDPRQKVERKYCELDDQADVFENLKKILPEQWENVKNGNYQTEITVNKVQKLFGGVTSVDDHRSVLCCLQTLALCFALNPSNINPQIEHWEYDV